MTMAQNSRFEQTPPPPYEEDVRHSTNQELGVGRADTQETIPKSTSIAPAIPAAQSSRSQVVRSDASSVHDGKHNQDRLASTGQPGRRKSSQSNAQQQSQFIDSLSAPKKFFRHITIEPLAFMAILALYIEFPSIQDLIYTKICLQVVAQHANSTGSHYLPSARSIETNLGDRSSLKTNKNDFFQQTQVFDLSSFNLSNKLPSGGRIQQPTSGSQITDAQSLNQVNNQIILNEHSLCDRLNKTAVPHDVLQEILDGNSLFWLKYQIMICLLCSLSSPYWGGMSDKVGRLIPLNVSVVTAALSNLISLSFGLLISLNSHTTFSIEWLYLGALITGLSGGQQVVIVSSFSFISDNTSSESRSKRVTVLEAAMFLSHSVGFYITKHIMSLGLYSQNDGFWFLNRHFVAFTICITLNLSCTIYSYFRLRHHRYHRFLNNFEREQQEAFAGEIIPSSAGVGSQGSAQNMSFDHGNSYNTGVTNDRLRELSSSNPDDLDGPIAQSEKKWTDWGVFLTFSYYKQTYLTATKRRESRVIILLLLLCGFISAMTLASLMSLLFIYLHMDPINWTTRQYSSWNSIAAITQGIALVSLTLCMKFVKCWNVPDPLVSAIGYLSKGVGLLMIALAQTSYIVWWALVAFVFSEFSMPPIRSLLSKLVVKEEVGKIYSCLGAMQNICFLFGNVIFYLAYTSLGLQLFFRLTYLIVAGFQLAAVIIMLLIYTSLRQNSIII